MKIAVFTDYFYPEIGGIQDSIATTSRALGARGHRIDIYAPHYGAKDFRQIGATPHERDLGANVHIHRRPSLPFPSSTRQSRAAPPNPFGWASLFRVAKPDIIHLHSFFGIGLEALLAAALLRIPVIGTNHTTIAGFASHLPVSLDSASAYVRWFHNRCDHVTAPSQSVFDELGGTLRPKLDIISNPIDTITFAPVPEQDRAAIRTQFGLQGPIITYAGRLAPEKNIDILLHALAGLHDRLVTATLAIAGHGSHERILRDLAAELRIVDHVKFIGTLAQPKLAQLLQISDTFAIMSTSETQSMVLLQAMASGIPVVAADTRALPEFVGPDNGVLVKPYDVQQLTGAFADLLSNRERRQQLGAAGRARAEQFGTEKVADHWERLYRSMSSRSAAA
jgi:glycosyltransferase involved in cell wall biosynthesis